MPGMKNYEAILSHFKLIYGQTFSDNHCSKLVGMLNEFEQLCIPGGINALNQKDSILICYADSIQAGGQSPLQALKSFLDDYVGEKISAVHLLPFFPYSSDDGFSVIDFYKVAPEYGTWEDIQALSDSYDLMFDAVINHISQKSAWFQSFLEGKSDFKAYFITLEGEADLRDVFRPRSLPLLTTFSTNKGPKKVWTTFSKDQVDLNFQTPEVLIEVIRILLMFVSRGARFIRLDAIGYIWKEIGTSCLHHENAHHIVQLFRLIFDLLAPHVQIITETNVPHDENIAYFGDGHNEAQLVYNFSLPPLVLHAFHRGNTRFLSDWAKTLELPTDSTSFFNFLASHDGIGVTPAIGLIPKNDVDQLCERVKALGGFISYKDNPDGSRSPYELNINFLDALGDPQNPDEPVQLLSDRFLASQSIILAFKGIPGIYYHSLLGSRSWQAGVQQTGRSRTINREKLDIDTLTAELGQDGSLRQRVFDGYLSMLEVRAFQTGESFAPQGKQTILDVDERLFCILREAADFCTAVFCLTNVTNETMYKELPVEVLNNRSNHGWQPVLARNASATQVEGKLSINIGAYGILWLMHNN